MTIRRPVGGSRRLSLFLASGRRRWLVLVIAAIGLMGIVAVALSAAGREPRKTSPLSAVSSTPGASPSQRSPIASPSPATDRRAGGTSAAGGSTPAAGGGSGGNKQTASSSSPFPTAFDVSAQFGSACVRPGQSQTITISTLPKTGVVYHAQYSDGKTALDPGYYGGNKGGVTGDDGRWTDSWVVAAGAPPGRVRVDVAAQGNDGKRGYTLVFFNVADATGKCAS